MSKQSSFAVACTILCVAGCSTHTFVGAATVDTPDFSDEFWLNLGKPSAGGVNAPEECKANDVDRIENCVRQVLEQIDTSWRAYIERIDPPRGCPDGLTVKAGSSKDDPAPPCQTSAAKKSERAYLLPSRAQHYADGYACSDPDEMGEAPSPSMNNRRPPSLFEIAKKAMEKPHHLDRLLLDYSYITEQQSAIAGAATDAVVARMIIDRDKECIVIQKRMKSYDSVETAILDLHDYAISGTWLHALLAASKTIPTDNVTYP